MRMRPVKDAVVIAGDDEVTAESPDPASEFQALLVGLFRLGSNCSFRKSNQFGPSP